VSANTRDYLMPDDELRRAWDLGFHAVEIEATSSGASAFVWRKYRRDEGRSMMGSTLAEAIHKAVDRVLDREVATGFKFVAGAELPQQGDAQQRRGDALASVLPSSAVCDGAEAPATPYSGSSAETGR